MRRFGATGQFGQHPVRAAAAALATVAAFTLTCGIATAEHPVPAGPTSPSDTATQASATPIAAQPLFILTSMPGGWFERTDIRPVLEVHDDGRAVKRPDAASPDRAPDAAPQQVNGTVPKDVLTAAISEVQALATVDMGTPNVTDQGTMIIDFLPQQSAEDAHLIVYAPGVTDGLDEDQKANRTRFAALYNKLVDAFTADR
ncbi:hypothetical protein HLB23_17135 [Nocardia uniformis]|uniref:Secreted protein n=1 Tax=Nocardia uniformis TaxID=53432 RepID=A0A849C573_9NOCA|nr:hypothetical protein [Nocardia uniformis]NNH71570.1 hypothetical protein [Nocardia uniformis]